MITLQSPYYAPQFTIDIKNPELQDNLLLDTRVKFIKASDGTTYGYKKTPALKKHTLLFKDITRRKGLELILFLKNSSSYNTKYIDLTGQVWLGVITNYPVELITTSVGRGIDGERKESCQITIEFEGVLTVSYVFFEDYTPVQNESNVNMTQE